MKNYENMMATEIIAGAMANRTQMAEELGKKMGILLSCIMDELTCAAYNRYEKSMAAL